MTLLRLSIGSAATFLSDAVTRNGLPLLFLFFAAVLFAPPVRWKARRWRRSCRANPRRTPPWPARCRHARKRRADDQRAKAPARRCGAARRIPAARLFSRSWDRLDAGLRTARGRRVVIHGAPSSYRAMPFVLPVPPDNLGMAVRSSASVSPPPPGAVHIDFKPDGRASSR
jgi:hypothetical protein